MTPAPARSPVQARWAVGRPRRLRRPTLLPGAPPAAVVRTIGNGTPRWREDRCHYRRLPPDPTLVALGRASSSIRGCRAARHVVRKLPRSGARVRATLPAGSPGVPQGSRPGHFSLRNAPSLLYVRYVPRRHFYQDDDAPAPAPFGGLFADGRADTLAEQVRGPLLDPNEMNNGRRRGCCARSTHRTGRRSGREFGGAVRDPEAMVQRARVGDGGLSAERRDGAVHVALRRLPAPPHAACSAEMRGLALFKNPDKGNCMSCHTLSETPAGRSARCSPISATTRSPCRATARSANRDPRHFDNGLCHPRTCAGPSPTNGAATCARRAAQRGRRQRFMHNGVFTTLRDAVAFYNTRSTDPRKWYHGGTDVRRCRWPIATTSTSTHPLNRRPGMPAALTDAEIDDIVAFLRTLTDARYVNAMPPATASR
jgi:cytochrome c peroxidase